MSQAARRVAFGLAPKISTKSQPVPLQRLDCVCILVSHPCPPFFPAVCVCAGEEQKQVQYVLAARKFATKVKRADLVAVIEAFAGEKRWRI